MNERYNDLERFAKIWSDIHDVNSPRTNPSSVKENLDCFYNSERRFYHNATHINEGLLEIDSTRDLIEDLTEVQIAWYFHDAIDNEEESAELASKILSNSGANPARISKVSELILATKHLTIPIKRDAQTIADVDLSILGKPEEIFDEYERNIRKEYSWVPEKQFKLERKKILESFVQRSSIYSTEFFRDKYENTARKNLAGSIRKLSD